MSRRGQFISISLMAASILLAVGLSACEQAKPPTPPTTALPVGMKVDERFHDIHAKKLQLKCETCHATQGQTYSDPLAQTVNPVDKRACLSCHREGSSQPFYGETWDKAKVQGQGGK
ncbi:MAG: Cytochrome c7 and related cytochrome c [Dehalococcoidia bacterium]|nr:Cytochrome c7 and related cytochrome c [Dehalococcoidia bacterium]